MKRLTELAHDEVRQVVSAGDVVIDATAGNGYDTCFLAELVGPQGTVHAFDVQQEALTSTAARLKALDLAWCRLHHASHAEMSEIVPQEAHGHVAAVMFNLGYLPGGDKQQITTADSTRAALRQAMELLRPGGLISILAYLGHPGGQQEAKAIEQSLVDIDPQRFSVEFHLTPNATPTAPRLYLVRKREL